MKVSVILVCYNEEARISHCLKSLLSMDYAMDNFEVVVVDNGSEDSTKDIIRRFMTDFTNIHLLNNPKKGIAISRNVGLKGAKYPFEAITIFSAAAT